MQRVHAVVRVAAPLVVGIALEILDVEIVQEGLRTFEHRLRERQARAEHRAAEAQREIRARGPLGDEHLDGRGRLARDGGMDLHSAEEVLSQCGLDRLVEVRPVENLPAVQVAVEEEAPPGNRYPVHVLEPPIDADPDAVLRIVVSAGDTLTAA